MLLLAGTAGAQPEAEPPAALTSVEELAKRVRPSVVVVMFEGREGRQQGLGTGFVIDADGHARDERMADALLGLRRFSPRITFLGSYPRADSVRRAFPFWVGLARCEPVKCVGRKSGSRLGRRQLGKFRPKRLWLRRLVPPT
jgi:hypothetical protein